MFFFEFLVNIVPIIADEYLQKYRVNFDLCNSLILSYISENSKSYPMKIGEDMATQQKNQMALFLVSYPICIFQLIFFVSTVQDFFYGTFIF